MDNPWDPFPFPLSGDQTDGPLYEMVGRTIENWERLEFVLAQTYSLFVSNHEWEQMQEYGKPTVFRGRLEGVVQAAERYFIRHCDQHNEAEFERLMVMAKGFSDRRNEVAHGVVQDVKDFLFWQSKLMLAKPTESQFLVVPPYYLARKHDHYGLPAYGYSTMSLEALCMRLRRLDNAVHAFNLRVWPPEQRRALP